MFRTNFALCSNLSNLRCRFPGRALSRVVLNSGNGVFEVILVQTGENKISAQPHTIVKQICFPMYCFSHCFLYSRTECIMKYGAVRKLYQEIGWLVAICKYPLRNNQPEPLPPCYLLSSMLKLTTFIHYEIIIIYTKCRVRAYANRMGVCAARVRW